MFALTDIKAHTVYKIVLFLPNLCIFLLSIVGFPSLSYALGFGFAEALYAKVLLSVLAFVLLGVAWTYIVIGLNFIFNEMFYLVIDVRPSHGLSEAASKAVLFGGQAALDNIEFAKTIRNPSRDLIVRIARRGNFGLFFKVVRQRLRAISDYYKKNPYEPVVQYRIKQILGEKGIEVPWYETLLNNALLRNAALQALVFLYLVLAQPNF